MLNIYAIESPTGKVYIGQTTDLKNRLKRYRLENCPGQPKLHASLKKYGWRKHTVKILADLPDDAGQAVLDTYEIVYMDFYRQAGFKLLNIKEGGLGGRHSPESIAKMRAASANGKHNWQGKKHTPETILKLSAAKKGRRLSDATKKKLSILNAGKVISAESKLKNSLSNSGQNNHFYGKKHTAEAKAKMKK